MVALESRNTVNSSKAIMKSGLLSKNRNPIISEINNIGINFSALVKKFNISNSSLL